MKIIGDKSLFAYQWDPVDHGKNDYWGNFCFWIGGVEVGIYEELTTLSISVYYLKEFLKKSESRIYFKSELIPKDKLYYDLYEKYFDRDYKGDASVSFGYLSDTFWLDEIGEDSIRDKIGLILLNEPNENRQRIIWKYHETNQIEEAFIPQGYFELVSHQFVEELSAEIDALPMTKKIGDSRIFAFHWELTDHDKTDYWGNLCFRIDGITVGIYEERTTLSNSLFHLKGFLKESENRVYFKSEMIPKEELFYDLYEKYFDVDYKGDRTASFDYCRDTFWLDDVGDGCIRGTIGLILINERNENRQRFIWKNYKTNQIEEAFIPTNYFEFVSRQFIEALSAKIDSLV